MSDNKITQDQLESNVMEELESGIGDLSTLSTENKDSLVAAVTEIYGKNVIAEAIGEPLAVTDTFAEMGNEINSLLSSFKTNMMNTGVVVESGDKFKALIDKIKGLTEGEGNKGVQYVEGIVTRDITHSKSFNDIDGYSSSGTSYIVLPKLNFEPTLLIAMSNNPSDYYPVVSLISYDYNFNTLSAKSALFSGSVYDGLSYNFKADELVFLEDSIHLPVYNGEAITFNWHAIGVGEEDTTLRDSLASILQEEGVDVTEEDDMAYLISKVDNTLENNSYKTSVSGDTFIMHNVSWQDETIRETSEIDTYLFTKGSVKVTMNAYTNLQAGSKFSIILYNNDGTVKHTYADGTYFSIDNQSWDIVDVVPGDRLYAVVNGITAKIKVSCDLL